MLIAHYIGPPKSGIAASAGWHLTVLAQKAPFDYCTHTEAIHAVHGDGSVTIASSSIADRGVRTKRTKLTLEHWIITDVLQWDVSKSTQYFAQAIENHVISGVRWLPCSQATTTEIRCSALRLYLLRLFRHHTTTRQHCVCLYA
jgi:hypothetical protein